MPTNKKEYMKEYMSKYNQKKKENVICETCGSSIKEYQRYKHNKTKKHLYASFGDKEQTRFTNDEINLIRQMISKQLADNFDPTQNGYDGFTEAD